MLMITRGKRWNGRERFIEHEQVDTRKDGLASLRHNLGSINGQTDEEYLHALHAMGITVEFQED